MLQRYFQASEETDLGDCSQCPFSTRFPVFARTKNYQRRKNATNNDSRVDKIKRGHQKSANRDSILSTKVKKLFTAFWSSFSDRDICLLGISLFELVMRNDVLEFFLLREYFFLKKAGWSDKTLRSGSCPTWSRG